jgi:hypothetical protein
VGFREGRGRRSSVNQHERKQMHRENSITHLDDKGHVHLKMEKKVTRKVLSRPPGGIEELRRGPRITS